LGKSQPLDKPAQLPNGIASIAGVFFTAFILFLLSSYYPNPVVHYTHTFGIFTAVCAIYFFDHYLDFKTIFGGLNSYTRLNKILAVIFSIITVVIVLLFWPIYFLNLNYWFGVVGVLIYVLLYLIKKPTFRFLKEIAIAATAAWVVCIKPDTAPNYFAVVALALLFFQNVILYSFMEKELDEYFGFRSAFNAALYSSKKSTLFKLQIVALLAVGIAVYFSGLPNGIGFVSLAYVLLSLFVEKEAVKKYYRFLLDAMLLGVFIP
jgi:hypothetical protein